MRARATPRVLYACAMAAAISADAAARARRVGAGRRRGEALGLRERPLRPGDRAFVVAAPERLPPHLVIEVRQLDVLRVARHELEPRPEPRGGRRTIAGVPAEGGELPLEPGLGRTVSGRRRGGEHRLVVGERLGATPEGREDVAETLANRRHLVGRRLALGERGERQLVVLDGVRRWRRGRGPSRRPRRGSAAALRRSPPRPQWRASASMSSSRVGRPPTMPSSASPARACSSVRRRSRRLWYATSWRSAFAKRQRRSRDRAGRLRAARAASSRKSPARSRASATERPAGSLATSRSRATSNTGPRTAASWSVCRVSSGRRSTLASRSPWMVGGTSAAAAPAAHVHPVSPRTRTPAAIRPRRISSRKRGWPLGPIEHELMETRRHVRRRLAEVGGQQGLALERRQRRSGGAPCGPLGSCRGPGPRCPAGRSRPASAAGRRADRSPPGAARPRPRRPSGGSRRSRRAGPCRSRRSIRRRIARKICRFSCSGSTWRKRSASSTPRTYPRSEAIVAASSPSPPSTARPEASFCRATSSESPGATPYASRKKAAKTAYGCSPREEHTA